METVVDLYCYCMEVTGVMLESMRQNLKSLQIFLWLVIAAFIGTIFLVWGQGGSTGGVASQDAIAWVNGKPISFASFENSYRNIYAFYKQMYGENLSEDALRSLQLEQVALNQVTQRELLLQEAQKYDLRVSSQELISAIQEIPQFQRNNRFDPEGYKQTLARAHLTPQEFEEQTEKSLLVNKLELLIKQTVRISDQELLNDYTAQNDNIEVEGLLVNVEPFKERAEVLMMSFRRIMTLIKNPSKLRIGSKLTIFILIRNRSKRKFPRLKKKFANIMMRMKGSLTRERNPRPAYFIPS